MPAPPTPAPRSPFEWGRTVRICELLSAAFDLRFEPGVSVLPRAERRRRVADVLDRLWSDPDARGEPRHRSPCLLRGRFHGVPRQLSDRARHLRPARVPGHGRRQAVGPHGQQVEALRAQLPSTSTTPAGARVAWLRARRTRARSAGRPDPSARRRRSDRVPTVACRARPGPPRRWRRACLPSLQRRWSSSNRGCAPVAAPRVGFAEPHQVFEVLRCERRRLNEPRPHLVWPHEQHAARFGQPRVDGEAVVRSTRRQARSPMAAAAAC